MSFIKNLKLRTKLTIGFGLVLILLINGFIFTYSALSSAYKNIELIQKLSETDDALQSISGDFDDINDSFSKYLATCDTKDVQSFNESYSNLQSLITNYKDSDKNKDRISQIDEILRLTDGYKNSFDSITAKFPVNINSDSNVTEAKSKSDQVLKIIKNLDVSIHDEIVKTSSIVGHFKIIFIVLLLIIIFNILISIFATRFLSKLIVKPISTVTKTFKNISEGGTDLNIRLDEESKDEIGLMAFYYNNFILKLTDQSWLKTGQNELSERIRGDLSLKEICDYAISYIAEYINAQIGVVYTKQNEDKFILTGTYAVDSKKIENYKYGDGLISQCVLEKKAYLLNDIPSDYIKVSSGLGDACPKSIILVPCIYNNEVKCILELASLNEFTDTHLELLNLVSENIAIIINMAQSRERTKELLEETLQQSEELQVQQEELRQSNEELQEQTKALVESEFKLQSQQEELRVTNEELEEKNKELQKQQVDILQKNENLEKVQKEIQEKATALELANKYKSEFLANVSHELRTPLNSIMVLSQLLMQKDLTQKEKEYAETINSAGGDLLALINDILDLAKVESGKITIEPENVNLNNIVESLNSSFNHIADKKGITFLINIDDDLPKTIYTDGLRLQQILKNFLSNAFKFTENGKVELNIKSQPGENSKNYINFSVSDTGIGIPKDKQDIIFEAFKQSDGTISRKYGGTGLGLTISKQLADLLNGEIILHSTEGSGSVFEFIMEEKYDNTPIIKPLIKEESEKPIIIDSNSKKKKILIIEDDTAFQNILADLAEEKGYFVLKAQDGETGLKFAQEYIPDAILLDVGLPGISGYEVADKLKNNEETKNIPVHIITGKDEQNIKTGNKIVGYLRKPVSIEQLDNVFALIKNYSTKPFQKLLIAGCSEDQVKIISETMNSNDIFVQSVSSGVDAYKMLLNDNYDCIILDYKLDDMESYKFLSGLAERNIGNIPVIIYTEKELSNIEEEQLKKYADSIIIRGSHSLERLEAETTIFLHGINKDNENEKKDIIILDNDNDLQGKKILLVDDDMRNVFSLSSVLENNGIEVVVGRNGIEGVNKFKESSDIDLILMDIMMPEMDGYTAIAEIRKEKSGKDVPIIALTAKAMKEDKKKCLDAGASDYLSKPVNIDKLISLIKVWLYK